ncbi:MAG TPA: MFS transporter [Verrucomicrobiae bacterium]|nr:MFS transporter [Verrucomicrobiae bacterium]
MHGPDADPPATGETPSPPEARHLREISPSQWRSGIAAWLGWLFDGLDMHLYTIVAAPFVMQLLDAASTSDAAVKERSSWIQAAFLVGWALGGGFFGRLGDRLGRSRALCLTILTYAAFTGFSCFVTSWWQLLICRFLAALGIGGEWAVGSTLLSETWPRRWRPWIAAVLQTAVNIGVLAACVAVFAIAAAAPAVQSWLEALRPASWGDVRVYPRLVFLVGLLPAIIVYWIRRRVPEPEEWCAAKNAVHAAQPGIRGLFHGPTRRTTLLTIVVCATSLTAWWAFMFWNQQHLRNLLVAAGWEETAREQMVSAAFFLVIGVSVLGNFFAGWLSKCLGYRRAIALMCLGSLLAMLGTFGVPRDHASLLFWIPWIGFFSGVFGLFTMYLPPLFPTLLRTTGAGFCYNIGRIAAAFGTVFFGLFAKVGDFRLALLYCSFLLVPAILAAWHMPDHGPEHQGTP